MTRHRSEKLASASFFCGLASLPLLFLAGVPAVILGHKARRAAEREGGPTSRLAVAGLVLGYLSLAVSGLLIALLAGSFSLSAKVAIKKARKTQAKNDCIALVQAVSGYFDDYGRLPDILEAGSGNGALTDAAVMDILLGFDKARNSREIRYFSGKQSSGSSAARAWGGVFYSSSGGIVSAELFDPWRKEAGGIRHHYLLLDLDGDEKITDPTNPRFTIHGRSAVAWSTGPDGKAHPDPAHPDNRDNVYSWK